MLCCSPQGWTGRAAEERTSKPHSCPQSQPMPVPARMRNSGNACWEERNWGITWENRLAVRLLTTHSVWRGRRNCPGVCQGRNAQIYSYICLKQWKSMNYSHMHQHVWRASKNIQHVHQKPFCWVQKSKKKYSMCSFIHDNRQNWSICH